LGNEWNLLRQGREKYYVHYDTLLQAADAIQANAQQIKSLDAAHPVCSILGEINLADQADALADIVGNRCKAVDVWGVNIYRGPTFGTLFEEWKALSTKPLYISEFGTDAFRTAPYRPLAGYEDEAMQAERLRSLWIDLAEELSAEHPAKVCVGGTVFEWNDEWWKSSTGLPIAHDLGGFETTWNPNAHPDGFANEEWFGIVSVERRLRLAYRSLAEEFAKLLDKGDVDRNGMVDLGDAVLALQNLVGILPPSAVGIEGDVNGDRRIGLEEAIYILQELAGLRL